MMLKILKPMPWNFNRLQAILKQQQPGAILTANGFTIKTGELQIVDKIFTFVGNGAMAWRIDTGVVLGERAGFDLTLYAWENSAL